MKVKFKTKLKYSNEIEVGDDIKVGGLLCTVKKVEDVFHYVPDARVRITLSIVGSTPKKQECILLLPSGTPITTLA